jgi:hypothetical protein
MNVGRDVVRSTFSAVMPSVIALKSALLASAFHSESAFA